MHLSLIWVIYTTAVETMIQLQNNTGVRYAKNGMQVISKNCPTALKK
jgi:hypothetical protein